MIDVKSAREVFEVNKRTILGAKVVRMNIWNDIQRYERGLQKLEREKEKESVKLSSNDVDLQLQRDDRSNVLPFCRDVPTP